MFEAFVKCPVIDYISMFLRSNNKLLFYKVLYQYKTPFDRYMKKKNEAE